MTESWQELGQVASQALAAGRYDEAAELFRKVVALRPDHADSWFNLAYSLRHRRHYAEAVDAYGRSLSLGVSGPEEALVNRALIYSDHLERGDLALADLERALSLAPRFVPALLNLGMLHEDRGQREQAVRCYRQLVAAAPAIGRAHARLAELSDDPQTAIDDLETTIKNVPMGISDLAEVEFALGNLFDKVGRYDQAFAAIESANARMAAQRPVEKRYDPAGLESTIGAIIDAFPERPSERSLGQDDQLIFICGMFRSGSTVFEQLLARHPLISAGGELEYIPAFVADYLQPYPQSLGSIEGVVLEAMRNEYREAIERLHPSAAYVTDKRPDNFLHLGLIKTLFPFARIVHTERNPLDILVSTYFLNFEESVRYGENLDDIAHYLGQYRRLMDHWKAIFGEDLLSIDYDQLVQDPETELARIFHLLDLETISLEESDEDGRETAIRTPSAWRAREPLHARSSGRWRNYRRQMDPYLHLLDG